MQKRTFDRTDRKYTIKKVFGITVIFLAMFASLAGASPTTVSTSGSSAVTLDLTSPQTSGSSATTAPIVGLPIPGPAPNIFYPGINWNENNKQEMQGYADKLEARLMPSYYGTTPVLHQLDREII